MAISNCFYSPTSENPRGFSAWCVLTKLIANPRNEIIHQTVSGNVKPLDIKTIN